MCCTTHSAPAGADVPPRSAFCWFPCNFIQLPPFRRFEVWSCLWVAGASGLVQINARRQWRNIVSKERGQNIISKCVKFISNKAQHMVEWNWMALIIGDMADNANKGARDPEDGNEEKLDKVGQHPETFSLQLHLKLYNAERRYYFAQKFIPWTKWSNPPSMSAKRRAQELPTPPPVPSLQ